MVNVGALVSTGPGVWRGYWIVPLLGVFSSEGPSFSSTSATAPTLLLDRLLKKGGNRFPLTVAGMF